MEKRLTIARVHCTSLPFITAAGAPVAAGGASHVGTEILRTCRAMGAPATLLLVESMLAPATQPDFTTWLDLHMLAMPGGQERTEAEPGQLLAAGFTVTRVVPTASVDSVIEAVPA